MDITLKIKMQTKTALLVFSTAIVIFSGETYGLELIKTIQSITKGS